MKYEMEGKSAFIQRNKGKLSKHKIDGKIKFKIVELYSPKYENSNCTHFNELLQEYEGIGVSETFVCKLLHENRIYPPRIWKRTKKYAKVALTVTAFEPSNEELSNQKNLEVPVEIIHPTKEKKKYFGEKVQMNASVHLWFNDKKSQLHTAIANSTNSILALYFNWQETLKGYYNLYSQILHQYGIPYEFSTDCKTVFEHKKKVSSIEDDTFTQFAIPASILELILKPQQKDIWDY